MFESNQLRVKPVRSYRAPRYPSHTDPDPTMHPTPVPYPATNKLLAAVAAMGMAASTSCSQPAGPATSSPNSSNSTGQNQPCVAVAGPPFHTGSIGVTAISYHDDTIARRAIVNVFQEAGYQLKPFHRYQKGNVSLVADGFDVDKRVGFVFVQDHNRDLSEGALPDGSEQRMTSEEAAARVNELLQMASTIPTLGPLGEEIQAAKLLPDPARRDTAFRSILRSVGRYKVSMAETRQLARPVENHHDFIAVFHIHDPRFRYEWPDSNESSLTDLIAFPENATIEEIGAKTRDFAKRRQPTAEEIAEAVQKSRVERLQQAVREYIAWARSQGAQ